MKQIPVLPPDECWFHKQMLVYTGTQTMVGLNTVRFDRNIPTFTTQQTIEGCTNARDYKIYDPAKEYPKNGLPVLVVAPDELGDFVASSLTIDRIAQAHPACPVMVRCKPEWETLLPPSVQREERQPDRYYRQWDLRKAKKTSLNPAMKALIPAHELMLQYSGIYDLNQDREIGHYDFDGSHLPVGEGIGYIDNGSLFSRELLSKLESLSNLQVFPKDDCLPVDLAKCQKVISAGDSDEALMAGYMNKPVLVFMAPGGLPKRVQYKQYEKTTAVFAPNSLEEIDSLVEKIIVWVNA